VPPIVAPVLTSASDREDRAGVLEKSDSQAESRGSGIGGGVGNGQGTGIGEGDGPGLGPGSGGGTGGGPYRPGSGIEPPSLLREVKPQYTEEARRRNVTGEVLLEIVVRFDGTVGDARVLQGLGYGLDQRAVDAVRQWRFAPAKRLGKPVDVMVEVAVEFRLRTDGRSSLGPIAGFASHPIEILVDSLDAMCQRGELTRPGFIKIDVEGAELQVLRGAEQLVREYRPVIVSEVGEYQ
jgi:TonB family protein